MDSQDYLDQISRSARPVKASKGGIGDFLSSKWFKWGAGGGGTFDCDGNFWGVDG